MPFDGRVADHETLDEVFSLAGLIRWLETQDPETQYDFNDCQGECLAGRYLWATIGWQAYVVGQKTFGDVFGSMDNYGAIALTRPWTYGAALSRARVMEQAARVGNRTSGRA